MASARIEVIESTLPPSFACWNDPGQSPAAPPAKFVLVVYDCKQACEAKTAPHRRTPPLQLTRLKRAIGATIEARAKAAGLDRIVLLPRFWPCLRRPPPILYMEGVGGARAGAKGKGHGSLFNKVKKTNKDKKKEDKLKKKEDKKTKKDTKSSNSDSNSVDSPAQ